MFLSGSSGSAEQYGEPIAEKYCDMGANVLAINYRNFGGSGKEGKKEGKGGSNPTEAGLYDDALNMFYYLKSDSNIDESNIIVHGFSLGGPVAATLVAHLADQGIKVRGLVLHSAMPSVEEAAADTSSEWAGKVTKGALGAFDTRAKLRRLVESYPELPLFLMGGKSTNDQLSPTKRLKGSPTGHSLLGDVQGLTGWGEADYEGMGFDNLVNTTGFKGTSGISEKGGHEDTGEHMASPNVEPGIQKLLDGPQPDVQELQKEEQTV